ncbi:Hypothetical predicted protein [Marmota monax]|uniref:WKF domain-containing protein n=1 Tax=Marmota monax TaxID=9995 RepID=A0A5E4BNZ7_MARMO|nr:Hypothetical predicted protein [Marmota monax]
MEKILAYGVDSGSIEPTPGGPPLESCQTTAAGENSFQFGEVCKCLYPGTVAPKSVLPSLPASLRVNANRPQACCPPPPPQQPCGSTGWTFALVVRCGLLGHGGKGQACTGWPGIVAAECPSLVRDSLWGLHWEDPLLSKAGARQLQGETASRVQAPGPELSPEERRVLERKLKKERKKEEKKRLREAGAAAAQPPPARRSGAELALDYLRRWAQKHKNWKFQKTRQTWLLLHMYDSDKVPDEHFSTLLAYLEGLKGRARELTVQKAEALIQELDEAGSEAALLEKAQRLRQVLQLLS